MNETEFLTQSFNGASGSSNATDGIALMMASLGAFMGVIIIGILIGCIVAYAVYAIILGKIFKKAGVKPSIAWIPVYNSWKFLEIGDQKGFWSLFVFIFPPITTVFTYISMYHIGKKLGKEDWFLAVAILVTPIWFLILAFDKSVWNGTTTNAAPAFSPTESNNAPIAPASFDSPAQTTPVEPEPATPTMPEPEMTMPEVPETPVMPAAEDQPAEVATEPTDSNTEQ